ncbi:mechanosensitive ion channel family protein [Infirmifilum uzonense]|uniref:mechanosensitive ion channel family protein n=1 Tax=Infirmifilum uzonense TaxID=1550241 RepID=UPI003C73F955
MRLERRILSLIILILIVILSVRLFESLLGSLFKDIAPIYQAHRHLVYAAIATLVGAAIIQSVATATLGWFKEKHRPEAYYVRNVTILFGYIILGFVDAALLGVSGESLLASATFTGLIIGLALQPVLSNFFSGILILASGFLKPGQSVRITGPVTISVLAFPAYKFFSRDQLLPSLKGTIIEVGFMFTKMLDTDGQLVKIPNSILLNSSIVAEELEESKTIQVRYEFPIYCDPDTVLSELRNAISPIVKEFNLYIEEQSDKQYYIVLIVAHTPTSSKTREFRSRVLREVVKVHRKLGNCQSPDK